MAELVRWLHTCGRQAGVRTPNVDERSRDIGRPEYLDSLQLGEQQLYDAQGNHFNPEAVVLAIGPLVWTWVDQGQLGMPQYLSLEEVLEAYNSIYQHVRNQHLYAVHQPIPTGVMALLQQVISRPTGGPTQAAAGRPQV